MEKSDLNYYWKLEWDSLKANITVSIFASIIFEWAST